MTTALTLKQVGNELKGAVAPERCMGCLAEGAWVCPTCRFKTPPVSDRCVACKKVLKTRKQDGLCQHCQKSSGLCGIVGAGPYGTPLLRRGVHWLKFKGVTGVANDLAFLMLPRLLMVAPFKELRQSAILMPIPLHVSKLRKRGFNQSEILARSLSNWTDIPICLNLTRCRKTWSQSKLPHDLRDQNMKQAFRFEGGLDKKVKWILLVDDVTTSGATLAAAAEALAGQEKQIWGVVVARR